MTSFFRVNQQRMKGGEHMDYLISGLFTNSKKAGEAVSELKQAGFTDDISIIAKDPQTSEESSHQVKQDVTDGALGGAATGGVLGAITGLVAGAASALVPGIGALAVAGPLAATWGITGGALGALSGGLVGALVDAGIPEEKAKLYEDRIQAGDVLVTVSSSEEDEAEIRRIFDKHSVQETDTRHIQATL